MEKSDYVPEVIKPVIDKSAVCKFPDANRLAFKVVVYSLINELGSHLTIRNCPKSLVAKPVGG